MIVLSVSLCPEAFRGDLTKWLVEIDTGVYVGNISARVRDELWKRICNNIENGRAIMVYNSNNVQGYEFKTHNTKWRPVDFDGLTLLVHPIDKETKTKSIQNRKRASTTIIKTNKNDCGGKKAWANISKYVVIDLETTGLDSKSDSIIELAAIRVNNGIIEESFSELVLTDKPLPGDIVKLTGINDNMVQAGIEATKAIVQFQEFIGDEILICHNAPFDLGFLKELNRKCEREDINNQIYDTLKLSRKYIRDVENYRLATLAKKFNIDISRAHRAREDAEITMQLFEQLKKTVSD